MSEYRPYPTEDLLQKTPMPRSVANMKRATTIPRLAVKVVPHVQHQTPNTPAGTCKGRLRA